MTDPSKKRPGFKVVDPNKDPSDFFEVSGGVSGVRKPYLRKTPDSIIYGRKAGTRMSGPWNLGLNMIAAPTYDESGRIANSFFGSDSVLKGLLSKQTRESREASRVKARSARQQKLDSAARVIPKTRIVVPDNLKKEVPPVTTQNTPKNTGTTEKKSFALDCLVLGEKVAKKKGKKSGVAEKANPALWEKAKAEAKRKMGGKHSARAMQLATQIYKKKGGKYKGKKPTAATNSMKKWTKQKWQWSKEKKASDLLSDLLKEAAEKSRGVYLPASKIKRLKSTSKGKKKLRSAENKKTRATRKGEQYSSHGLAAGLSYKKKAEKAEKDKKQEEFTPLYDNDPRLKGDQSELPDRLQELILKAAASKKDPRLERAGVEGYNKPKRTPNHPTKSHIVVAKEGDKVKTIRFGQQGVRTNQTAGQRKAFKSRHKKNIDKGKMSAAYWADRVKWSPKKTKDKKNQKWVKGSSVLADSAYGEGALDAIKEAGLLTWWLAKNQG